MGVARMGKQRGLAVGGESLLAEQVGGRGLEGRVLDICTGYRSAGTGTASHQLQGISREMRMTVCFLLRLVVGIVLPAGESLSLLIQDLTGPGVLSYCNSACYVT